MGRLRTNFPSWSYLSPRNKWYGQCRYDEIKKKLKWVKFWIKLVWVFIQLFIFFSIIHNVIIFFHIINHTIKFAWWCHFCHVINSIVMFLIFAPSNYFSSPLSREKRDIFFKISRKTFSPTNVFSQRRKKNVFHKSMHFLLN